MPKTLADYTTEARAIVPEVAPSQVPALIEDGWILLDVREADEFAEGHIPGARHLPRGFLEVRADLHHPKRDPAMADRAQRFVVTCGGGHRSLLAARVLHEMGFAGAVSMTGGHTAWLAEGRPVEK